MNGWEEDECRDACMDGWIVDGCVDLWVVDGKVDAWVGVGVSE